MRLLCIDTFGESVLDWLLRCRKDGHQVKWYVGQSDSLHGRGIIERVSDWRPWIQWADIVFLTDNLKYLRELDGWRKRGVKIVGPTWDAAQWELNRTLGMKVLEKHGIECPDYREFSDYDAAIRYVKQQDRPFVSKPCGDETDKALSYVAKSPADLVYMLERWKKSSKLKGSFILQEKIEGIEVGVGRWFGPGGFNRGYEENAEFKKLMPGDCGPNTGEMGSYLRFVQKSKLGKLVLDPLEDTLEELGYLGCIDVNCIVDDKGKPWPLEFTSRPGWPAFLIQQAIHEGDHLEWLYDLCDGKDAKCFVYDKAAIGVVVAIGDFPHSKLTKKEVNGVPVLGIGDMEDSVHPCQVMLGDAPQDIGGKVINAPCWVTSGDYVMVVTGTGDTVSEAMRHAYTAVKKVNIPTGSFYRNDIGRRLSRQLPKLKEHGYFMEQEF